MTAVPAQRAGRRFLDGPKNAVEHHLSQFARRQNLTAHFDRQYQRNRLPWVQLRDQAGVAPYTCGSIAAAEDWLHERLGDAGNGR